MPLGPIDREIAERLDAVVLTVEVQHGGCVGEVYRVQMEDGRTLAVKADRRQHPALDCEAWMLDYLTAHSTLPVPRVVYATPELLAMEFLPGYSDFSKNAELHAAELLADLHGIRADHYGLERDTLIGALLQPNTLDGSWVHFFREQRLLHFAQAARNDGKISNALMKRIEALAGHLDKWLEEPAYPALIHGDVWSGNVLAEDNHICGFIDPAIYFAHPEIELAFITLFNTFGSTFFNHYHELRPISPGFFETRRHIYNLYPLLVHVRLFGGGYVDQVERTLQQFGY